MNEMMIFSNPEFGNVRTVTIDGNPWFVGNDVAKALGYVKERNAIANHVDKEDALKCSLPSNSGVQETTTDDLSSPVWRKEIVCQTAKDVLQPGG